MADVALVSLGGTVGLRAADSELASSMRRAGASVLVVEVEAPAEVRTFALTDLKWALAARRTAAGEEVGSAGCVLYSSVTAALLWPRVGAIRFDALAALNRPGRHGIWQRRVERTRLHEASLLVPWSEEALAGAPSRRAESVVVPVPVEASGALDGERDIAAITYGAHPAKKGLDRVFAAWLSAAQPGEELVVAGIEFDEGRRLLAAMLEALVPAGVPLRAVATPEDALRMGVRFAGRLDRDEYRALLRRARVFVTAPRREDHGIAQLEALADGCCLVTSESVGPYVALPIARALDERLVVPGRKSGIEGTKSDARGEPDPRALGAAIRVALDDPLPDYAARAAEALAPLSHAAVDATVANELLPRLIG